jgi:hypothetical protein
MKFRSIILFTLVPVLAIAQRNANLEFSSGLNFTDYSNKIANTKGRLNYDFGLAMTLPTKNPNRDLVLGMRFIGYGDKYESRILRWGAQHDGQGGFDENAASGEVVNSVELKNSYYYLELPVGIRQYLANTTKCRLFLQATLGPSYFLSGRTVNSSSLTTLGSQSSVSPDNSDNFRLVNFVADLGLGLEIPVSEKLHLQFLAHGQTQLLDIVSNTETHPKWYAAGLRAGLRYRLF